MNMPHLELWHLILASAVSALTVLSGFWLSRRKENRADHQSLSQAEQQFRMEMRGEMQKQADEIVRLDSELTASFDLHQKQRKADRRQCDDEFEEMRTVTLGLHKQNTEQQMQINNLVLENSHLKTQIAISTGVLPGGRRLTDHGSYTPTPTSNSPAL